MRTVTVAPFFSFLFESSVNFDLLAVVRALLQARFEQLRATVEPLATPTTFSEATFPWLQRSTASPSTAGGGSSAISFCTGPPAGVFFLSVPPTWTAYHWPGVTMPDAVWVKPALSSKQLPGRSGAGLVDGFSNGITRSTSSKLVEVAVMSATP